jgi:hypothetical protein
MNFNFDAVEEDCTCDWSLLDDLFEERAAILEYDAGYTRYVAEQEAAQALGFSNMAALKNHVQKIKTEEQQYDT